MNGGNLTNRVEDPRLAREQTGFLRGDDEPDCNVVVAPEPKSVPRTRAELLEAAMTPEQKKARERQRPKATDI